MKPIPKFKVVKECINQDNRQRMRPGDIVTLSAFEMGRHLAEGNIEHYQEPVVEVQFVAPPENRMVTEPQKKNTARRMEKKQMKKYLFAILLVLLIGLPSWAGDVGSCTESMEYAADSKLKVIKLTNCTASGTALSWSVRNASKVKGHMLLQVNAYPGTTAPTAASDLNIYDEKGGLIGGTQFADIITTSATETVASTYKPIIWGDFYIQVANNSQAGAITTIWLFFYPL